MSTRTIVLTALSLLSFLALAGPKSQDSPAMQDRCPVFIDLPSAIFKNSSAAKATLRSSGPATIFIPNTGHGAFRVHTVAATAEHSALAREQMIKVPIRSMVYASTRYTFTEPPPAAYGWSDVGVSTSADGSNFVVPPGLYRFSITFGTSDPRTGFRLEPELCRVFSAPFRIEESSG